MQTLYQKSYVMFCLYCSVRKGLLRCPQRVKAPSKDNMIVNLTCIFDKEYKNEPAREKVLYIFFVKEHFSFLGIVLDSHSLGPCYRAGVA